jgi:hypothetical protein
MLNNVIALFVELLVIFDKSVSIAGTVFSAQRGRDTDITSSADPTMLRTIAVRQFPIRASRVVTLRVALSPALARYISSHKPPKVINPKLVTDTM